MWCDVCGVCMYIYGVMYWYHGTTNTATPRLVAQFVSDYWKECVVQSEVAVRRGSITGAAGTGVGLRTKAVVTEVNLRRLFLRKPTNASSATCCTLRPALTQFSRYIAAMERATTEQQFIATLENLKSMPPNRGNRLDSRLDDQRDRSRLLGVARVCRGSHPREWTDAVKDIFGHIVQHFPG